jgi:release factor glutamine methyltransferase
VSETGLTVAGLVEELTATLGSSAEARELVAALRDAPRTWAVLHGADPIDGVEERRARLAAHRRRAGAPMAYAVGRAAFRHLTLDVDERVLIPRPETEVLVDLVLEAIERDGPPGGIVVDVGTGSGAIALALATEGRALFSKVIGTDVSADALAVATNNGKRIGAQSQLPVEWRQGAALAPVRGLGVAAVVSNPPYISADEAWALPAAVRAWEPPVALVSGPEGLDATRVIVREAGDVLVAGGLLALEIDIRRATQVVRILEADGRYGDVRVRLDLTERERFVIARRRADGVD